MNNKTMSMLVSAFAAMIAIAFASPAFSQTGTTTDMQILRDKIKADKKLLIASNMELTESEAKGFWPVYEAYQKDLLVINERLAVLVDQYVSDYAADALTDEKAKKLVDEMVAIDQAEANLKTTHVPKLNEALPSIKVARYLQLENKIRAAVKYEIAASVPLVP